MTSNVRRQPDKERKQRSNAHEPSSAYVRSPALQSAEEKRGSKAQGTRSRSNESSKSYGRLASEQQLANSRLSRKSLPRLKRNSALTNSGISSGAKQQKSGLTADWRMQTAVPE